MENLIQRHKFAALYLAPSPGNARPFARGYGNNRNLTA